MILKHEEPEEPELTQEERMRMLWELGEAMKDVDAWQAIQDRYERERQTLMGRAADGWANDSAAGIPAG